MAENSLSGIPQTTNGRLWRGIFAFLLLGLLLLPWLDGMTPATTPLRFLQRLPFPAGNVLFACYLVAGYLYLRMAIYGEWDKRFALYRCLVAIGAMGGILRISELASSSLSWVAVAAWLLFCAAAVAELIYLHFGTE